MSNLLDGLNQKQLEAVTLYNQPLRIIAGAGSGKTRVITTKIAYLIKEKNIIPFKILAMTFTNKAAKEMQERLESILGVEQRLKPWISTFHSFCSRILREEYANAGLQKNFLIIDTYDKQQIIKKIVNKLGIVNYEKKLKFDKIISTKISNWKNELLDFDEIENSYYSQLDKDTLKVYKVYQQELKENNQVDFDDLQNLVHQLFNDNKTILKKWQDKYDYVLVDEFQDTNEIQFDLIKWLTKDKNNLTVVGDPDQTIYSWRGAKVSTILNFEKSYKNAKTIILDENYRSTKQILDIANNFIEHNINREKKNIYTKKVDGKKVIVKEATSKYAEAKSIATEIKKLVKDEKYNYNDIFVLYRSNFWSAEFEKVFTNSKIPFQLIGGIKFRDRKVIKDAMAFLKSIAVKDDISIERVLRFTPKIGDVTIEKIEIAAADKNLKIVDFILNENEELTKITKHAVELKETLMLATDLFNQNSNVEDIARICLINSGYIDNLKVLEKEDELKNIQVFYDQLNKFDQEFEVDELGIENKLLAFLQEEALISNEDENLQPNKVTLLTIHSAKGLEAKVVFIVGLNKDIFPSRNSMKVEELEEERRTLYVALTRAKERLYLSYVKGEFSYVSQGELGPSKFIQELDENLYEFEGNIFIHADGKITSHFYENVSTNNFGTGKYKKGDLVSHILFGDGVVVKELGPQIQIAFSNPKIGVILLDANAPVLKKK